MNIIVDFSDFNQEIYANEHDAQDAILEAHAEGVNVKNIEDINGNPYSCVWTVLLQKEC